MKSQSSKKGKSIVLIIIFIFVLTCMTAMAVKPEKEESTESVKTSESAMVTAVIKESVYSGDNDEIVISKSDDAISDEYTIIGNELEARENNREESIKTEIVNDSHDAQDTYNEIIDGEINSGGTLISNQNEDYAYSLEEKQYQAVDLPIEECYHVIETMQSTDQATYKMEMDSRTDRVVGYYAAWAAYSGYTPDKINALKLEYINYAFANIGSDNRITLGYPDVDSKNFEKLRNLKNINPNLKILIAVGGWSWSGRFSDAALTESSRSTFADSCVEFVVKYGLDGVDIDWEYPVSGGLPGNIKRPEDKQNFTLLMKKIREKLNARSELDGKQYLLTFAGAANAGFVKNTELPLLNQYVDYVNLMTYDIHGSWDSYTDLNAPLYKNTDNSPQYKWSQEEAVNTWINAGFPANKLVMGIPFYGYIYHATPNANRGLYQTFSGASSISYANIVGNYLNNPQFTRYFHEQSKVPWLFNGSTFISYEDEQSITAKIQYIKSKGLGGAMMWELSQDLNGVLLKNVYDRIKWVKLCNCPLDMTSIPFYIDG